MTAYSFRLISLILSIGVASTPSLDGQEIEPSDQKGPPSRQRLLSGAVLLAIIDDNVPLLKDLQKLGWDPNQPMCDPVSPEGEMESLHAAAYANSIATVKWLLDDCEQNRGSRDRSGEFPIEYVWGDSEEAEEVRRLLRRPNDGGVAGLMETVLIKLENYRDAGGIWIVDASQTPDSDLTIRLMREKFNNIIRYREEDFHDATQFAIDNEGVAFVKLVVTQAGEDEYVFEVSITAGVMHGYEFKGIVSSSYGYWIATINYFMDS